MRSPELEQAERSLVGRDLIALCGALEERFPDAMALLRLGGVYPGDVRPRANPYDATIDTEYFGVIGEHCIVVAECAAALLDSAFGPDHPGRDEVIERGLIHDALKGLEIMRRKASARWSAVDGGVYSPEAYEAAHALLVTAGATERQARLAISAGRETGHDSLARLVERVDGVVALREELPVTEHIVHLADAMVFTPHHAPPGRATSEVLTSTERMTRARAPTRYAFLYTEGFGFDEAGRIVRVGSAADAMDLLDVRTYAAWQELVASQIARRLLPGVAEPESALRDRVRAQLRRRSPLEAPY